MRILFPEENSTSNVLEGEINEGEANGNCFDNFIFEKDP